MTTFSIENFGCRATDADAAALRRDFLASGLALVDEHACADVVVLNTCTVTAAADAQAREAVRKIHRANPGARVVVTGCYAQRAPEEIARLEGVDFVVGNSHQTEIARLVCASLDSQAASSPRIRPPAFSEGFFPLAEIDREPMSLARGPAKILTGDIFEQTAVQIAPAEFAESGRTRPILKIQDGCNNRCSYCVIPFVRGKSRSLPPDAVIAEVRNLVDAGAKEVVLSGINLGSYGRDLAPRTELINTVRRILDETTLEQLRFSSIEPQDVTEELVELVASAERIAPHFHVAAAVWLQPDFARDAPLVSLRALRRTDSPNSPPFSRRCDRCRRDRWLPRRNRRRIPANVRFHRAPPANLPARFFVFSAARAPPQQRFPSANTSRPELSASAPGFCVHSARKRPPRFAPLSLGAPSERSRWREPAKIGQKR